MAILFVHGIAVRVERFNDLLKSVRDGVTQLSPGLDIYGCYWGDLASPEVFKGASVPGFLAGTRSPIDHITMDAADWIIDPLVQLTALRDDEEFTGGSGITECRQKSRIAMSAFTRRSSRSPTPSTKLLQRSQEPGSPFHSIRSGTLSAASLLKPLTLIADSPSVIYAIQLRKHSRPRCGWRRQAMRGALPVASTGQRPEPPFRRP